MIFRKQLFIFFFILMLLISPVMAYAVGIYNVVAYDNSSLGIAAWGVNGYNYVMSDPTITIQHVSSLYVWRDPFEYHSLAEVGWVWRKNQGPRFFAAWLKGGVYGDLDLGAATPGTNHNYTIRHAEPTTKWYWLWTAC